MAKPNSLATIKVKNLFRKYGLNYRDRQDAYKLNRHLTRVELEELKDLALELYRDEYIKGMDKHLQDYPMTFLTFFSNSINGGRSRGVKALQRAVGAIVDGKAGPNTYRMIKKATERYGDEAINLKSLEYMASFYRMLIRKNKRKFYINRNGWYNRIYRLGYRGNKLY